MILELFLLIVLVLKFMIRFKRKIVFDVILKIIYGVVVCFVKNVILIGMMIRFSIIIISIIKF